MIINRVFERYDIVIKQNYMIKNYSTNDVSNENMKPSDSTIQFLLDFSKSLNYVKSQIIEEKIELNLN